MPQTPLPAHSKHGRAQTTIASPCPRCVRLSAPRPPPLVSISHLPPTRDNRSSKNSLPPTAPGCAVGWPCPTRQEQKPFRQVFFSELQTACDSSGFIPNVSSSSSSSSRPGFGVVNSFSPTNIEF